MIKKLTKILTGDSQLSREEMNKMILNASSNVDNKTEEANLWENSAGYVEQKAENKITSKKKELTDDDLWDEEGYSSKNFESKNVMQILSRKPQVESDPWAEQESPSPKKETKQKQTKKQLAQQEVDPWDEVIETQPIIENKQEVQLEQENTQQDNDVPEIVNNDAVVNEVSSSSSKTNKKSNSKKKKVKNTDKPKRNVSKMGDKLWVEKIPPSNRFNENTVLCFAPGKYDKIGNFICYGKKQNSLWLNMFKKNSNVHMSKPWAVRYEDCDIVEHNGMMHPNYFKDENGVYHRKL